MNRWFIFRRRSFGPLTTARVGEAIEGEEAIRTPAEPIVLPPVPSPPTRVSATRGRGRGASRGAAAATGTTRAEVAAATPPPVAAAAPTAVPVTLASRGPVKATRGRGGLTRPPTGGQGRERKARQVTFDL